MVELAGDRGLAAQRRHGQGAKRLGFVAGGNDHPRRRAGNAKTLPKMRHGPGRARGGGHGRPGGETGGRQASEEVLRQGRLPTPEMGDPGDIKEQAVGGIGRHGGGKPRGPVADGLQIGPVGVRGGLGGEKVRNMARGVGRGVVDIEMQRPPHPVHGDDAAHAPDRGDEGERPIPGRGGVAATPGQDRPVRPPHAKDTVHDQAPRSRRPPDPPGRDPG